MIGLLISDLEKSVTFYKAIGFSINDKFPQDRATHMILSDTISVILLTHSLWQEFTSRKIPNAKETAQVGFMLSKPSKDAVDTLIQNGQKAGGKADPNPIEDFEGMYGRSIEDPDGHIWEAKWMNFCMQ